MCTAMTTTPSLRDILDINILISELLFILYLLPSPSLPQLVFIANLHFVQHVNLFEHIE